MDYVVKCTAYGGTIVGVAVNCQDMVYKAQHIHNLYPVVTAAFGRTLAAASMMSTFLKNEGNSLTIQVKGDGPIGGMLVVADNNSNVRGYVNNSCVDIPLNSNGNLDVVTAVGKKGYINVVRDLGLKDPYVGYVDIMTGDIAYDLAYYYATSEQTPSIVSLGVLIGENNEVLSAGGYIIQVMPGVEDFLLDKIEKRISNIKPVSELLYKGYSPEDILKDVLEDTELKFSNNTPTFYKCNCSNERMFRNFISIGKEEIIDIFKEQDIVELECYFCGLKYNFNKDSVNEYI